MGDSIATSSQPQCSSFYIACRQNDVNTVIEMLSHMTVEEIDRIEPNGSTALHVASYHGHDAIVRLLLDTGASRTIKNRYQLTAFQEARNEKIKQLFTDYINQDDERRFVAYADSIEWLAVNERAEEYAVFYRKCLQDLSKQEFNWNRMIPYLTQMKAKNPRGMELVYGYMLLFLKTNDPTYLVRAYTVESAFYRTLNQDLAKMIKHKERIKTEVSLVIEPPGAIAALISYSSKFDGRKYVGITYRGMSISDRDLNQYRVNSIVMIKSLLSTSKTLSVAENFIELNSSEEKAEDELCMIPVICHYTIRNKQSALDIEDISHHTAEKEVLILPFSVFKIKAIEKNSKPITIKLEEETILHRAPDIYENPRVGFCGLLCFYGCPWCYRVCFVRCCGVVDLPDEE